MAYCFNGIFDPQLVKVMLEKRKHKRYDEESLYPMVIAADYARRYDELIKKTVEDHKSKC